MLLGHVVGLRPVLGPVVELPHVVLEGGLGVGRQPGIVPGHRRPPLVVDAPIADQLEVLRGVALGGVGGVEGVAHAGALVRPLGHAVHLHGSGSPAASSTVGATSITWVNWWRSPPFAVIPPGQCTMVPLRVPPQWEATCFVHW